MTYEHTQLLKLSVIVAIVLWIINWFNYQFIDHNWSKVGYRRYSKVYAICVLYWIFALLVYAFLTVDKFFTWYLTPFETL